MPFHQLWIYIVSKKHSGKADQLTLASGGTKHACMHSYLVCQVFAQTVNLILEDNSFVAFVIMMMILPCSHHDHMKYYKIVVRS